MIGKQLLETAHIELEIEGKGKDIATASSDIFKSIHRNIYKTVGKPIIQMETKEVYFDSVTTNVEKKALKRDAATVHVKARVILEVKYLDLKEEEI